MLLSISRFKKHINCIRCWCGTYLQTKTTTTTTTSMLYFLTRIIKKNTSSRHGSHRWLLGSQNVPGLFFPCCSMRWCIGKRQEGIRQRRWRTLSRPASTETGALFCIRQNPHITPWDDPWWHKAREASLPPFFLCCWIYTANASCRVFCRVYMAWRLFFPSFYFSSLFYRFFLWEPLTRTKGKTECFSYIVCRYARISKWRYMAIYLENFGSIEMEIFRLLPKSGIQNQWFLFRWTLHFASTQ